VGLFRGGMCPFIYMGRMIVNKFANAIILVFLTKEYHLSEKRIDQVLVLIQRALEEPAIVSNFVNGEWND